MKVWQLYAFNLSKEISADAYSKMIFVGFPLDSILIKISLIPDRASLSSNCADFLSLNTPAALLEKLV